MEVPPHNRNLPCVPPQLVFVVFFNPDLAPPGRDLCREPIGFQFWAIARTSYFGDTGAATCPTNPHPYSGLCLRWGGSHAFRWIDQFPELHSELVTSCQSPSRFPKSQFSSFSKVQVLTCQAGQAGPGQAGPGQAEVGRGQDLVERGCPRFELNAACGIFLRGVRGKECDWVDPYRLDRPSPWSKTKLFALLLRPGSSRWPMVLGPGPIWAQS